MRKESPAGSGVRYGLFLMMFGFGFTLTMIAPLLPRMVESFALTLAQGSLFTVSMNTGGILGVALVGLIGERFRKNLLYLTGYAVLLACLIIVGFAGGYEIILALFFVLGAGSRISDTLANPLITENYREDANRNLNMMHMSISLGGLLGPVTLRLLMELDVSWQNTFRFLGGLCLFCFIFGAFLLRDAARVQKPVKRVEGRPVWFNGAVITAGLIFFFYSGHQIILNVWSSMYMEEVYDVTPMIASASTTLFWIGITVSRLIGSHVANEKNARALIRGGAALGAAALAAAVFTGNPVVAMACFTVTGLLSGAIIPILMFIVTRECPDRAGQISSALYLFSMTACMAFPWICGVFADNFGFEAGMSVSVAALFAVAALTYRRFY